MAKVISQNLYTDEQQAELESDLSQLYSQLSDINGRLIAYVGPLLTDARAKEYLLYGVCRRIQLISKTLTNIFDIFPLNQSTRLSKIDLDNLQINLHAFLINTHGLLDNLAWVYVLQKGIFDFTDRHKVGLFKPETKKHLPIALKEYLAKPEIKAWFEDYATDYRDALAHRIPLYVPPFSLTAEEVTIYTKLDKQARKHLLEQKFDLLRKIERERDALGSVCPTFLHSFSDSASNSRNIHFQTVDDAKKVNEIADIFCKNFG